LLSRATGSAGTRKALFCDAPLDPLIQLKTFGHRSHLKSPVPSAFAGTQSIRLQGRGIGQVGAASAQTTANFLWRQSRLPTHIPHSNLVARVGNLERHDRQTQARGGAAGCLSVGRAPRRPTWEVPPRPCVGPTLSRDVRSCKRVEWRPTVACG
jgi:hypothetical protein